MALASAASGPAHRQAVGDLTVERVVNDTGTWWVWRNGQGRQVHAGLGNRQLVLDRYYERGCDGRWLEVREP